MYQRRPRPSPFRAGGGKSRRTPSRRVERYEDLLRLLELLPEGVRNPAVFAEERRLGHISLAAFAKEAARPTSAFCGRL